MNKSRPRPEFEFVNHLTMMWRQIAAMRVRARINQEAIAKSAEAIVRSRNLMNEVGDDRGAPAGLLRPEEHGAPRPPAAG